EDPYGAVTYLDANWNVRGSSSFAWIYLHQGGRLDTATGLYGFRHRDYSPTLGRWMQLDPISYRAGDSNLYRYERNIPTTVTDPSGTKLHRGDEPPVPLPPFPWPTIGEGFYVCERLVQVGGLARKCDCQHTDIYGTTSGEVYRGWFGPVPPTMGGLP